MSVTAPTVDMPIAAAAAQGYWTGVFRRLLRDKVAVACALDPRSRSCLPQSSRRTSRRRIRRRARSSSGCSRSAAEGFLLGSDELGRDMLSRLIYGGRLSLLMGISPVVFALLAGSFLGIVAGFVGGRTNTVIMRTVDVFFAFPSVLLAVAISGALGAGIANALLALTVVFIPPIARVAESVTTQVRSLDFVEAARASGAGAFTIIRVHILGNVLGPIFVYATSLVSVSMILAAGLSFLGLGTKPPDPEWGLMLNTLRTAIYIQPWVAALPGALIFVVSISFNLLSDGMRSAMDVQR